MVELVLVRGLPGSGKSTLARSMKACRHFEADMFFMHNGEYRFDPERVSNAHRWCQFMARTALSGGRDVVVSNTFTRAWEMKPYFDMAEEIGASIRVVTCDGIWKNVHGVPDDAIERMAERWEPIEMVDYV